jgi:hypothetical protein
MEQLLVVSSMQHEMDGQAEAPLSLTSALDEGEWSASRPCRFTTWKIVPGTRLIVEGSVGPRASLNIILFIYVYIHTYM